MRAYLLSLVLLGSTSLFAQGEYSKISFFTPHRVEPINFFGDGLLFSRSDPSNRLLAYDDVTGNHAFDTNLINVASRFGYQIGTNFFITPQSRFVLVYAHGHWNRLLVKVTPDTSVISPFFNSHVSRTETRFLSKLSEGELNYRYLIVDGLGVVTGVHYFYEDEDLEIFQSFPNAGTNLDYSVRTFNHLAVLQLGGELSTTIKEIINFELALKLGGGLNFAKQRSQASLTPFFSGSKKQNTKNGGALLLEVDLVFRYEITPKLFIRAGYDALFLSGLSNTVDNLSQTPLRSVNVNAQGLTDIGIDTSGQMIYTKSFAGVEYRW